MSSDLKDDPASRLRLSLKQELLERIRARKVDAFACMNELSRMDAEMLKNCGYRSTEEALLSTLKNTNKEIESWIKTYEKRFPD